MRHLIPYVTCMLTMLSKKYRNSTIIVFDGYGEGPYTKDSAHLRRSGGVVGVEVKFVEVCA